MRIVRLELPEDILTKYGLKSVKLDRLKRVVIVTGKNGAGKTRLFNAMREFVNQVPLDSQINQYKQQTEDWSLQIEQQQHSISYWKGRLQTSLQDAQVRELKRNIESTEQQIKNLNSNIASQKRLIDLRKNIEFSSALEIKSLADFVPKTTQLRDISVLPPNHLDVGVKKINEEIGAQGVEESAPALIEKIQKRYVYAGFNATDASLEERENAKNEYDRLLQLIHDLLGAEANLLPDKDGFAKLFGRKIGEQNYLSAGQSLLLQFAALLFAQGSKLDDVMLFMDEPENHLHPSALIEILERLLNNVTEGQIWIATHSVPLIGHFFDNEDVSVLFMEDGSVKYAGRTPETVLEGLLGNEEERAKIASLLHAPAQFALEQYSYECLFVPKTVETDPVKDPQTKQIFGILGDEMKKGNTVRLLDFGAGKGRLISAIDELSRYTPNIRSLLDYFAYDKINDTMAKQEDIEKCQSAITRMYGTSQQHRYFTDKAVLLAHCTKDSFDMIILCNVFHEIEHRHWLSEIFATNGIIRTLLKPNGHLLIVEDQLLSIGEKAYQHGFLVFDEPQFRKLFALKEEESYFVHDAKGNGQLKAHFISKHYLERVSIETQRESIGNLKVKAEEEIKKLREEKGTHYRKGKLYAFWMQQYVNASFTNDELSG
jgi:ABC-type multidrug transport system ATPase subunit